MGKHRKPPEGPKGPDEVDYEVGYRKTPKTTRFKKGQSGNPGGRPKAAPNTKALLNKVLAREVTVTTAEGPTVMPMSEVLLTALAKEGAQGKVGALKLMFDLSRDHEVGVEPPDTQLAADDAAHFERLRAALQELRK